MCLFWGLAVTQIRQLPREVQSEVCFGFTESSILEMNLSFITSLKACAKKKDLYHGCKIHAEIYANGLLEKDTFLANTLISMYAKCGALVRAQQVINELPVRDVVSWTAIIAGYVHHGQGKEALACFRQMQSEDISPDAFTYACILKACGITKDADVGKQIHDEIVSQGLLKKNIVLGNALVDMYAKCGVFSKARRVLDELHVGNAVAWTALIAGFVQRGQGKEALSCFQQMRSQGLFPDAITYACVLKACCILQDVDKGKQIHDEIVSQGLLKNNVLLGNALVDMYAKCGFLLKAQNIFEMLPVRDLVSWNALIVGFIQHEQGQEALGYFRRMQCEGFSPDAVTYACVLKACGIVQDVDIGKQVHDEIVHQGMLEKDIVLGNAVVDMYAKCGVLLKAQKVFDSLRVHNVVSWNALISGFVHHGQGSEALGCFHQMQSEGFSPDAVTYACILKVCGIMSDVQMGKQIHDEMFNQGLLENNVVLGNALVDMYTKCGVLVLAQRVLDELPIQDVVSWTALVTGYAKNGQGREALDCFHNMRSKGVFPNVITYACILKVCGFMQDIDLGKRIHDGIASQGLLKKNVMLSIALVDMYAKCGGLAKAQQVLDELPVHYVDSWNLIIAGFVQHGQGQEALACFHGMRSQGFSADVVTYACILNALYARC